ncbi:MAG TPA: outer membrane lipid asymmetry maintenance protein MlaD [Syntrophaceae bacterium]|jgi:phospholipid/cholesterol/gamma-HCH transport system substrate-binding protein|nr:outer membrane lipid asymmetry maintenance protein MlaD [Syntrophaceae bacterium]
MRKFSLELNVGIFFIVGILCLAYLSIKLGKLEIVGSKDTVIYATFSNIGGLKEGAEVQIAGVNIGRVKGITLDDYQAKVRLQISTAVPIQDDAIASIKTKGLVGEKFVEITPGGSDNVITNGGTLQETLPPFDIERAISKWVFGKASD